jgi:hypothetical protein
MNGNGMNGNGMNGNGNGMNDNGMNDNGEDCGCEEDGVIYFHNDRSKKNTATDDRRLTIPWNLRNFEGREGEPRVLTVPVGTILHFESFDEYDHSVVESTPQFKPKENPIVDSRDVARPNYNELVELVKAGTYYFVGGKHPKEMRLVVNVSPISNDASNIIDGV